MKKIKHLLFLAVAFRETAPEQVAAPAEVIDPIVAGLPADGADGATAGSEGLDDSAYTHVLGDLTYPQQYNEHKADALNSLTNMFVDIAGSNEEERTAYRELIQKAISNPSLKEDARYASALGNLKEFLNVNLNPYLSATYGERQGTPSQRAVFSKESFFGEGEAIDYSKINGDNLKDFAVGVMGLKDDAFAKDLAEKAYQYDATKEGFDTISEKYENVINLLEEMPLPLRSAVHAFLDGNDWITSLNNASEITDKDFSTIEINKRISLASRLTGLTVPEDAEHSSETVKWLLKAGEIEYNKKRDEITKAINGKAVNNAEIQTKYNDSVSESISDLKAKYSGDISPSQISKVQKVLKDGFASLFVDNKGMIKKDAAEKLALALFGGDIIKTKATKVASRISSEREANLITKPQSSGSRVSGQAPSGAPQTTALLESLKKDYERATTSNRSY